MKDITQIRKLSLWIFIVPFIGVNLCLLISVNYSIFENTIFIVDQIGRSKFTIPYIDGSLSISRASRTYPQYLIFKPAMFVTSVLLIFYWYKTNSIIQRFQQTEKNFVFKYFGIASAILLLMHAIFLGIEFDSKLIKFFRRVVLLGFIISEITAQASLILNFYKIKRNIIDYYNHRILILKTILVSILILVAILSIPILNEENNVHFKHWLEWNYFIGVILFYLFTYYFWKKE